MGLDFDAVDSVRLRIGAFFVPPYVDGLNGGHGGGGILPSVQ